jgi:hypothetical protein
MTSVWPRAAIIEELEIFELEAKLGDPGRRVRTPDERLVDHPVLADLSCELEASDEAP